MTLAKEAQIYRNRGDKNVPECIRQTGIINSREYKEYGGDLIDKRENETLNRAKEIARKYEMTEEDMDIQIIHWYPHYLQSFVEIPMYLLGPNAPKINGCRSALAHSDMAIYEVIIRDKRNSINKSHG